MGAGLDGVGLEIMPRLSPAAPLRVADADRREAEAQVLGISETGLHPPPFRVQRDDLRRVTIAGHQAPGLLHALGVHAHVGWALCPRDRGVAQLACPAALALGRRTGRAV